MNKDQALANRQALGVRRPDSCKIGGRAGLLDKPSLDSNRYLGFSRRQGPAPDVYERNMVMVMAAEIREKHGLHIEPKSSRV